MCKEKKQDRKFVDNESKLEILFNKFDDFVKENQMMKNIFGNLESKIIMLEAKSSNTIESTPEDIFSELLDRQAKCRNLIFFNILENPLQTNTDDIQSIPKIFRKTWY